MEEATIIVLCIQLLLCGIFDTVGCEAFFYQMVDIGSLTICSDLCDYCLHNDKISTDMCAHNKGLEELEKLLTIALIGDRTHSARLPCDL